MKRARTFSACILIAVAAVVTPPAATAEPNSGAIAAAGALTPDQDPFYRAPADIASLPPGRIVASRQVTPNIGKLPVPVNAWQISYRSTGQAGEAILAVTTLMSPTTAWTKKGKRPIVSYQAFEDSVGSTCAPSYNIVHGNFEQLGTGSMVDAPTIAPYLQAQWALAIPDHEGPQAYFGVGRESGPIALDGIRAVKTFTADDSIGPDSPVGLSGYSGGAQATGWAAQLQPTYAPDAKLVGAAVGGMPADLARVGKFLDGGPLAGFEFAVAQSFARAYPSAGISELLNDRGRTDFQTMQGMCLDSLLTAFPLRKLGHDTTVEDPLAVPSVAKILELNTLGVAGAPQTPIYDYHVDTDEVVPVDQDNATVKLWRGQGTKVQLVRDLVGGHRGEYTKRLPSTVEFLQNRFDGVPFAGD